MSDIHQKIDATSYNYGPIETPFIQKTQIYDAPIGQYRLIAYRYRVATFILLAFAFLLGLLMISLIEMPRSTVFAAQVIQTGYVKSVGVLDQNYVVPEGAIKNFVEQYLTSWFLKHGNVEAHTQSADFIRGFSSKPVIQNHQKFLKENGSLSDSARMQLTNLQVTEGGRVIATFEVPKLDEQGKPIGSEEYTGEFGLSFKTPQNPTDVYVNPLGLFVEKFKLNPVKSGESS